MSDLICKEEETNNKNNTCNELKNIQYQSMLLNQKTKNPISVMSENLTDLDAFLDKEKEFRGLSHMKIFSYFSPIINLKNKKLGVSNLEQFMD